MGSSLSPHFRDTILRYSDLQVQKELWFYNIFQISKKATVPQPVGGLFMLESIFVSVVCEPEIHLESKTSETHLLTESTARHSLRVNNNNPESF